MEPHRHANNLPHFPVCDECRGCIVGMCMALAGCTSAPPQEEPLNFHQAKRAVSRYCDSGGYVRDIETVVAAARAWLEERVARRLAAERLAVVLDIDETVLSNAPLIRSLDFAFQSSDWQRWHASADAPAIEPVRAWYEAVKRLDLAVFFITGRREASDRASTVLNLERRGMGGYDRLVMAPDPLGRGPIAEFKTRARRELEREGFIVIANVGDQESDLRGGHAERSFKLPDPFYLVE